jgi:hypothetical protein
VIKNKNNEVTIKWPENTCLTNIIIYQILFH